MKTSTLGMKQASVTSAPQSGTVNATQQSNIKSHNSRHLDAQHNLLRRGFMHLSSRQSIVLSFVLFAAIMLNVPQRVWAETETVTYSGTSSTTVAQWEAMGNSYVTVTHDGSPTMNQGTYRIPGTNSSKNDATTAKKVTFTAKTGIYITSYSYNAYQTENGGSLATCDVYFKDNATATTSAYDVHISQSGETSRTVSNYNQNSLYISQKNSNGQYWFTTKYTNGAINNVVLNLLIPEILTIANGQTAPTDQSWVDKTWTKNTEKSVDIVYDVADALAASDFTVSATKTNGNGTFSATIKSYSNNQLTITVKYKTANTDDYAENFSGTITVSSVNTVNTATYTTTINGTAGAILSDNNLRFDILATQYVNTNYTTAEHTYANSNATITYSSSNESVAYFDETKTLRIVGVGNTTLTATQPANSDYKAGSASLAITVSKRTAHFVYTPSGNLYTSHNYERYVSVDNDPNGTLPTLVYSVSDPSKFKVDADGTAHTYAVTGTLTLTITADATSEWNAINISKTINIVKDPTTVDFCMSDAYVELGNTEFCRVSGTGSSMWIDNEWRIGSADGVDKQTTTVVLAFKGIPDKLKIVFNRKNDGIINNTFQKGDWSYTLTIKESADGITWPSESVYSKTKTNQNNTTNTTDNNENIQLSSSTRYLQITYTGCRYVFFSSFCVTAATDMTVSPTTLALEADAEGTTGEFTITHSNMAGATLSCNNSNFIFKLNGTQITSLDASNGMGIGAYGDIAITAEYVGSDASATGTLTITGTKVGGGTITRTVNLSITHPKHYLRAVAQLNTGNTGTGKIFMSESSDEPDASDYSTSSITINKTCSQGAGDDNDQFTFYLWAKADEGSYFAGWRETPAGMAIDQNDDYLAQTFTALSKNSASPTVYNRYAVFFDGFPGPPSFLVNDLDMGYTFSGGRITDYLYLTGDPSGRPKNIDKDKISVTFQDIAGHTGESAAFRQEGSYLQGSQALTIVFEPTGAHATTKTYQAKAVVTAINETTDEETGNKITNTVTHECIVTATCYPAEAAVFTVPEEIDFGAIITAADAMQTKVLQLDEMVNVYGTPTLTPSTSPYFIFDAYNATTQSFTIHYNTSNTAQGLLRTTVTVTGLNADGVATTHDVVIKVFVGKPDFTLSNLNLGSTTSGGDFLYGNLALQSANGLDVGQVSIIISDAAGHAGESQYFIADNEDFDAENLIFPVRFVPSAATPDTKTYMATATITATNASGTTTKSCTLSATVQPAGAASFTIASSHTFTSVQRNETDAWNAEVTGMTNIEGEPTVAFSGTNAAYFSFGGYNADTHILTINFTPQAVGGVYSATAAVTFYNRDGRATTQNVSLKGSCIAAPAASFEIHNSEGQEVNNSYYGDFYVGEPAYEQTFYIANIQNMKVGSQPTLTLSNAKFSQVSYNPVTQAFVISFAATAGMEGVQSALATFTMLNNDDQETSKTLSLSAFVVIEPDYDVEVIAADGTTVLKQGTWAECLTVANTPANANCTMRLIKNISLTATSTQAVTNTFTLDLNGKTLSAAIKGSVLNPKTAGKTLTIKDSKSGGKIQNITDNYNGVAYGINISAGAVVLKSGTIHAENTAVYNHSSLASLGVKAVNLAANASFTMDGGVIEAIGGREVYGIYEESSAANTTQVTINNGTINAEAPAYVYGIMGYGKVDVRGGTINVKVNNKTFNSNTSYVASNFNDYTLHRYGYGIRMNAFSAKTPASCYYGTLTMTGGTINVTNENKTMNGANLYNEHTYGIYMYYAFTAIGTSTGQAADGTNVQKASAIGSVSNATINITHDGVLAYGVLVQNCYNSYNNTTTPFVINNSKINVTSFQTAYGVYANAYVNWDSSIANHTGNGGCIAGQIEMNDCVVRATTTGGTGAYGAYVGATSGTVAEAKTTTGGQSTGNATYKGEYAVAGKITINNGNITATAATTTAHAVYTPQRAKTIRSIKGALSNRDASTDALGSLGGNAEAFPEVFINGGSYKAITETGATAHTIRTGGYTTIIGGDFESNAATSSAVTIYSISGKTTISGATLKATAKTDANAVYCPATVDAYTLYDYAGEVELNNCNATVNTTETTNARGVYVYSATRTHLLSDFTAAKTANNSNYKTYGDYWQVGCKSISGKATINGGTYTVKAYTSNAYGVLLTTNALSTDGTCKADGEIIIKNATFNVEALGTNGTGGSVAYGVQAGGRATIDGCTINAATKTSDARGVYSIDEKTVVSNSTINATTTTSSAYGIIGYGAVADNGIERIANFELNEGNKVTAKANTEGAYAVYMTGTTGGAYSTAYFTGSMAVAAGAVINGGTYTANATTKTAYALHVSGAQVKNEATAYPSIIVNDGKFKGTSAATFADVSAAGIAGHVVLNGGYYVLNTNLSKYAAEGKVATELTSGRAEYTEGYRYEIASPGGNYVCQINSTKYKTLEEALQFVNVNSSTAYTIYMIADYTLPKGDYVLPAKATLLIPYTTSSGKGGTTAIGAAAATTTSGTTPSLFRKLTFANGANLTCLGIIETSAQQKANGQYGACVGMPSGPYGQIDLKEGSHISLENGAKLYCWGYITGKGTIDAKRGSTSLEGFQLGDWCGGTNASNLIGNSQKVFPVTHYFYQSIECPITYRPGSSALGSTHISVNVPLLGTRTYGQDAIALVGTSGSMFLMDNNDMSADTWVMKDYDEKTDQCVWTINSGASIGNLTINISSYNMASKDYDLPITTNMSIVMNYGTMSIGQNAVFLPSSKLIVNKEATADINGVTVVAYDASEWTGTTRYFASYSPTWGTANPRKSIPVADAEVFVHGKVDIRGNGGLYTTASGANIHSTNADAGEVIYTTAAQGDKTSYYLQQGSTNKTALTVNPARLKNGVADPAFSATASTVAGKTWTYINDAWQCWSKDGCKFRDAQDKPYAKPAELVQLSNGTPDENHLHHDAATGAHNYVWDADCYWWEVETTPATTGIYKSLNADHNGKYNYYEYNTAAGCWKIKTVTVTFNVNGTNTNYTVNYGTQPKWLGATPTKSGYIWDGWTQDGGSTVYSNTELPNVTTNTIFTAHFYESHLQYNITFKNDDGQVLESKNWNKDDTPTYSGGTPVKEATASQTFSFSGNWSPTITTVTAAKEYTAQYNAAPRQYDVTFLDYDNQKLETKKVNYNAPPTFTGTPSTPVRTDPSDFYEYTFSGWQNQQTGNTGLTAVQGDQTYVAQYSHHRKWFFVTFVDYNGTTIKTGKVLHDMRPTAPANPTREQDAQYTYSFSGWAVSGTTTPLYSASNIPIATANITYVAQYNATLRSYDVRFFNYDGTQIGSTQTLNYGATPTEPDHASFSKPSTAEYEYIFSSWDDIIREVTGAKDYTAQYLEQKRKYTVTFYDEDGTTVLNKADDNSAIYQVEYGAKLSETPPEPTKAATAQYTYVFDGWLLSGTTEPLILSSELKTNNSYAVTTNTAYVAHYREEANSHTIAFYNTYAATPKLEEKPVAHGAIPEYTGTTPAREQTAEYTYTFVGWIDYSAEEASATPYVTLPAATADASYKAKFTAQKRSYTVTFYNEDGTQELQSGSVEYGTVPTYSGTTQTKASDEEWDYTFDGWQAGGVGEVYSTLPEVTGNVSYTAHFNPTHRHFVVTFKDEDGITVLQTLSGATAVEYGTTPTYTGSTPTKDQTEDYTYTFAGWSPALGNITSDATFTATYTPTERFYGEEYKLDIVEWSANGANQSITLNMNNYSLPTVKTEWTVQVGDRRFYNAVYSRVWRDNRTLVINNLTLTPGEYIVLKVRGDNDECVSRLAYTVPYIYNANATLTAQGEMAATSTLCVNNGTLTINADITADQVLVSPGASLTINAGKTLTVNKTMLLRTTPFSSAVLLNNGSLTLGASAQMYYSRIMSNNSQSYQWGLPFSVDLTKTRFSNGTDATQGRHFGLMYYDAVSRAQNGKDALNWVLYSSTTQQRNTGYQMIVGSPYYFEIYFPVDYSTRQTDGAQISVTAYGEESNSANNRGWNYIVSPYTHVFNCGTPAKPEEALKISVLNSDNETFTQYVPTTIQPAMPFYYQAEETGTLEFTSGSLRKLAPRRMSIYNPNNDVPTQWIELLFGNAADELDKSNADITNIYLHPTKFSAEYELGYDVAKLSTQGARPLLWAKTAAGDLAFAALPDTLAQNLPLAVSVPTEGLYTFALNDNDYTSRIDNLILLDALTGTETDLRRDTYTCLIEAGQTTARFFLIVKMKESDIATDTDNIGEKSSIERPVKLFIDGYIYILMPDGRMYDAVGKRVE